MGFLRLGYGSKDTSADTQADDTQRTLTTILGMLQAMEARMKRVDTRIAVIGTTVNAPIAARGATFALEGTYRGSPVVGIDTRNVTATQLTSFMQAQKIRDAFVKHEGKVLFHIKL